MSRAMTLWFVSICLLLGLYFTGLAINNRLKYLEGRVASMPSYGESKLPSGITRQIFWLEDRVKALETTYSPELAQQIQGALNDLQQRMGKCEGDKCGHKQVKVPPSCPRSKFCPCTPPCQCSECRCGGITIKTEMVRPPRSGMGVEVEPSDCLKKKSALPAPGTPLLTAVVHDGKARIAWIDGDGRRQERTLTEEEFCKLNTKSE